MPKKSKSETPTTTTERMEHAKKLRIELAKKSLKIKRKELIDQVLIHVVNNSDEATLRDFKPRSNEEIDEQFKQIFSPATLDHIHCLILISCIERYENVIPNGKDECIRFQEQMKGIAKMELERTTNLLNEMDPTLRKLSATLTDKLCERMNYSIALS